MTRGNLSRRELFGEPLYATSSSTSSPRLDHHLHHIRITTNTMNKPSKEEAFDLSDSTDWLKTPLPLLSSVDSALRCQVCKDFYTTPMITSCAHTFCSLCIRRCLNNDGRCPACRAQDQELKLRFNAAMEDLVEAFKKARPELWEFANKPVEILQAPSPKRRRLSSEGEDESPRKLRRTRSSGRNKPKEQMVVDSAEDDEDYVPGKRKSVYLEEFI